MTVEMLKGKIHRATVVQAELDYVEVLLLMKTCWKRQELWNMRKFRSWM